MSVRGKDWIDRACVCVCVCVCVKERVHEQRANNDGASRSVGGEILRELYVSLLLSHLFESCP